MNNEYKITLQIPYSFMSIKLKLDAIGLDITFTDSYNVTLSSKSRGTTTKSSKNSILLIE